ncbi:hypothetical protein E8E13_003106 [Curvularia kusanoi]|uniref:Uncharacterized protein n=1 Tax=Curvularia kusanoi TaxID=90978 RepID=A0A9P4T507_CURKU|nr:hypothetical protein E8E13_003106 [Curvularia kusanoi]
MNATKHLTSYLRLRIPIHSNATRNPAIAGSRTTFARTMASDASNTTPTPTTQAQEPNTQASSSQTPLPLPEPSSDATTLNVGGEGVKLDHLGPLVVNKDGTLSRIANWDKMAEIEKQNTLRILGKRNQLRLGSLREGEGKVDGKA